MCERYACSDLISIDKFCLANDGIPEIRAQALLGNKVHFTAKAGFKELLKTNKFKEPDGCGRIKSDKKVYVTVYFCLSAHKRTEQCDLFDVFLVRILFKLLFYLLF